MRLGVVSALLLASPVASAQTTPPNKSADQAARRAQSGNLVGHGGPVKAIAIASDGSRALTGSFDYSAILWDISGDTPKQLLRFADHNGAVNAVAFVGQTRALTAGDDSVARLWDTATGKPIHRFEGHAAGSKIVGLTISDDYKWAVSSGWDRSARLWNLEALSLGPLLNEHSGPVNAAVFSADGMTVYTASYDGAIRAFDAASGALLRRVHATGQSVNTMVRLASGTHVTITRFPPVALRHDRDELLFGTVSGQSMIVDGKTGSLLRHLPDSERPILALADGTISASNHGSVLPTGTVVIGSADGRIRVLNYLDGSVIQDYKSAFGPVWALATQRTGGVGDATALYFAGLDDFVTYWPFAPRAAFEPVDASQYPRRFQQTGKPGDDTVARGEMQFARKCSICHTLTPDGANRAGPSLHNIFGRRIATQSGYPFSEPLKTLGIVWTPETLSKLFELGPDKFTPGSKMPLQVLSETGDRDDLVAFLAIATRDPKPVDGAPLPPQESPKR